MSVSVINDLRDILKRNHDDMFNTYDFDGIAEGVLKLVSEIDAKSNTSCNQANNAYEKDFDGWNENKKHINSRAHFIGFKEREVWYSAIGVNVGHEQDGKNELFERPILVLKKYNHRMLMAIPLSRRIKDDLHHIPYLFGGRMYAAVISQARLIDSRRLLRKIYTLPTEDYGKIKEAFIGQFTEQKSDLAVARPSEPEGYSKLSIAKPRAKVNTRKRR
ncbi:type II toxin-antitoxin system PemK/MazF family toxin [Candidatus Saccharibacteria bacterium]|nr:type II toxin-antitoxin system PemK/MazF family toxin [Candidatus Saccharibacteria bacterium]